ncbi:DUF1501 domain-containing protein [Aquirufa ecclesiirivi]|uniref:DUF1501 domain-containing protein n=1 Tax=Aquirufa ecclesiirivi TaxID=2715124 RepID=UPI0022A8238D|nr:DUF1501 domain-containing protein [Aquirufa ecclesiirivi]MCZ2471342.1 DUF1501 domain-containing protein [Aquirufa ecclesiirivi]
MKRELSRQQFLRQMALLSGGMTWGLGSLTGKAYGAVPFANAARGKVLVIIQLNGGNDGLNTIIPADDDNYFSKRPDISIKKADALPLSKGMYMNPAMMSMKSLYDKGQVAITQSVGYANPNRSHFRATDIWNTGSDAATVLDEGWAGRFLEMQYPEYPIKLPKDPMAIQLGSVESLLFQTDVGRVGTVFEDPNLFYQLVSGTLADSELPPATLAGDELAFLKQIASSSIQYSTVIRDAANKAKNAYTYPNTNLAKQLSIIARLVAGGLETPVYLANIGGFDTHANQKTQHANLWKTISEAVSAFQNDISNQGLADAITVMTFSEFGRRVNQNGTQGTDHGTAAPMLFIGNTVRGGLIGSNPSLTNLDSNGDLRYNFDYRQIYSTVLRDHLGLDAVKTQELFKQTFERVPIFKNSPDALPDTLGMEVNSPMPNPVFDYTVIQYAIYKPVLDIKITLYDLQGQEILTLFRGTRVQGTYQLTLNALGLTPGIYLVHMSSSSGLSTHKRMIVQ